MDEKLKINTYGTMALPYVGPGLDYTSWNGALLVSEGGGLFGVRIGFFQEGKYITGYDFFDRVNKVGSRAADGTFARITADPVTLTWAKVAEDCIMGSVQALKANTTVVLECYTPYDYPGLFEFNNENVISGKSPKVYATQGDTLVTGGVAIVEGRTMRVLEATEGMEHLTVQFSGRPTNIGTCEKVDGISVQPVDGIGHPKDNKIAYAVFNLKENEVMTFTADLKCFEEQNKTQGSQEDMIDFLSKAEESYDLARAKGTGLFGQVAEAITSELFWIMTYHPYLKRTWVTLGRHWIEGLPWNIWGWDECFAGIIASLESEEVARNCVLIAYQDMRVGPYAAWKVYSKYHDQKLLESCYPFFRDYYPDSGLVRGDVAFLEGKKQGNYEVGKGMDDTLMRDVYGLEMYSLDGSCQKAWNFEIMAKMAEILGDLDHAERFNRYYQELKDDINAVLWNEEEGIYLNRYIDSREWKYVESPTCFYPLLAGIPNAEQLSQLMDHLLNPEEFWGEYVIPTLNKNHPEYGLPSHGGYNKGWPPYCYWRGNIWPPSNYLVYQGIKRYELDDIAYEFAKKSTKLWQKNWNQHNWACENYHPETGERSEMSYNHYNWSMLLPLMGIEELLDVEVWNNLNGIRFGNIGIDDWNALNNVSIHHSNYNLSVNKNFLSLVCNGEKLVELQGTAVIRNFAAKEQRMDFEINCKESIALKLLLPKGGNSTEKMIGFGKWKVSNDMGVITLSER